MANYHTLKKSEYFNGENAMLNLLPQSVVVLINEMRKTRFKEGFECPHCASEHVVRFGKYNGRQRYRCKCCSKTFTDTNSTVLYRTRNGDEWISLRLLKFNV